jgi:hypothetical protein
MLTAIHPKLPMRNKAATQHFYIHQLEFEFFGNADYADYLMVQKDQIQLHFFKFENLNPKENYGQIYLRTDDIHAFYGFVKSKNIACMPLERKAWGMYEFSMLDPDNNLLTIGQNAD